MAGDTINASNYSIATYWKNGTATNLTDGTGNAYVDAIAMASH